MDAIWIVKSSIGLYISNIKSKHTTVHVLLTGRQISNQFCDFLSFLRYLPNQIIVWCFTQHGAYFEDKLYCRCIFPTFYTGKMILRVTNFSANSSCVRPCAFLCCIMRIPINFLSISMFITTFLIISWQKAKINNRTQNKSV